LFAKIDVSFTTESLERESYAHFEVDTYRCASGLGDCRSAATV
jgi:hypothetical protein